MGHRASLDGCGKARPPTGFRSPDRPVRSDSLYWSLNKTICVFLEASSDIENINTKTSGIRTDTFIAGAVEVRMRADRNDCAVEYEYWYIEMKVTKSREVMAHPRLKYTDFKIHVLGLCTKFVKQNIFQGPGVA